MSDLVRDYSAIAPKYDARRFTGRSGRFVYETDRRIVTEAVSLIRPRNILDVPTGTGRVIDYLKDQPAPVTGVDQTPGMLAQATRFVREGHDRLMIGDASRLPFPDGSFECVISLRFFHLFGYADRGPFAAEFTRVLAPGGHLLLSFTNGWYAGGLNWMKQRLGRQTVHFQRRGELQALFPGWTVVRLQGNFLPLQGTVSRIPVIGALLRWSTDRFPANRVCWERYYLLRKPG